MALTVSIVTLASASFAEEVKIIGSIVKVQAEAGKATVVIKDNDSGKNVTIVVTDQLTLDKLQDKRISNGDEVRVNSPLKKD